MKKEIQMLKVLLTGCVVPVGCIRIKLFRPGDLIPALDGAFVDTDDYWLGVQMQRGDRVVYLNTDAISIQTLLNSFSKMSDEEVLSYVAGMAIKKSGNQSKMISERKISYER